MKNKNTWKAIIAVILVVASLTSMASLVSAGWIENILEEVSVYSTSSSSAEEEHKCVATVRLDWTPYCEICNRTFIVGAWICQDPSCDKINIPIKEICTHLLNK